MTQLNNAQKEILKMFDENQSEEELLELKQILCEYIATKLMKEIEEYNAPHFSDRQLR